MAAGAAATAAVAADVLDVVRYPLLRPVIFTVIFLPWSEDVRVRVDEVAPEIATPLRYHWYVNEGLGDHAAVLAVSLLPTLAVPEIAPVLASSSAEIATYLDAHVVDKAAYELQYELAHRPDRVAIPVDGLLGLTEPGS